MKKLMLLFLLTVSFAAQAMVWETNKVYHSDSVGRDLRYGVLLPSGYNWQTNKYYPVIPGPPAASRPAGQEKHRIA